MNPIKVPGVAEISREVVAGASLAISMGFLMWSPGLQPAGSIEEWMRNRGTCGDSFGICKYTQRGANNLAFYQTLGVHSCSGNVEGRNIQLPLSSRDVSVQKLMNGSKHFGTVHHMIVFSFLRGDFGIRNVCCFSFGKYCLSKSNTQLKSFTFLNLNTRARFQKMCKPCSNSVNFVSCRQIIIAGLTLLPEGKYIFLLPFQN